MAGGVGFSFPSKFGLLYPAAVSSNPIYAFFATPSSYGPFLLRMLLTAVFLTHGGQKTFGWFGGAGWGETLAKWSSVDGLNMPVGLAAIAITGELLVAVSMFFGFLTRLSALGVMAIMTGAIVMVHARDGIPASEYPFALFMIGLALLFQGGGRLSLDRAISSQLLPAVG